MKKLAIKQELRRLIAEADEVAPSIVRFDGRSCGNITDEGYDAQRAQRWELQVSSVIQQLAATQVPAFALLNGQYYEQRAKDKQNHSRSIFVGQAKQSLITALELMDSPPGHALPNDIPIHGTPVPKVMAPREPDAPEKVTISWLARHVPVKLWAAGAGIILGIFVAGIKAAQYRFVQEIVGAVCK